MVEDNTLNENDKSEVSDMEHHWNGLDVGALWQWNDKRLGINSLSQSSDIGGVGCRSFFRIAIYSFNASRPAKSEKNIWLSTISSKPWSSGLLSLYSAHWNS